MRIWPPLLIVGPVGLVGGFINSVLTDNCSKLPDYAGNPTLVSIGFNLGGGNGWHHATARRGTTT